jgi:hypothetical protein
MSVRKAARQFSVPRQTLRNRAIGKIDADCIFNFDSENAQLDVSVNDKETCLYDFSENIILRLLAVVHILI